MGTSSLERSGRVRWIAEGGLFLEPRLRDAGIPHGFTSRGLGDMRRSAARRQAAGGDVVVLRQRHGTVVHEAAWREGAAALVGPSAGSREGDGIVSRAPGLRIGVFATDCQPLFLWDHEAKRAVGAFHAGWRGTARGMGRAAVEALSRLGIPPADMAAAVGPHIGPCCYRVGEDLAPSFRPGSLHRRDGGLYLELGAELRAQLVESGVPAERVALSGDCTFCRQSDFFSYRRAKDGTNMLAFIARPGSPA